MKKNKKEWNVSLISIVFYVVSVIFLAIAAFYIYQGYLTVQSYQTTYTLTFSDIIGIYFSACAQYFAYAFILYGIGAGLNKISVLNNTLASCMDEVVETQVEEVSVEELTVNDALQSEVQ